MNKMFKTISLLFFIILATAIAMSLAFDIPYLFTFIGFAIWAFIGHLVTLDDDAEGGWSNPDDSRLFWRRSVFELCIKLLIVIALLGVASIFPTLSQFGA